MANPSDSYFIYWSRLCSVYIYFKIIAYESASCDFKPFYLPLSKKKCGSLLGVNMPCFHCSEKREYQFVYPVWNIWHQTLGWELYNDNPNQTIASKAVKDIFVSFLVHEHWDFLSSEMRFIWWTHCLIQLGFARRIIRSILFFLSWKGRYTVSHLILLCNRSPLYRGLVRLQADQTCKTSCDIEAIFGMCHLVGICTGSSTSRHG